MYLPINGPSVYSAVSVTTSAAEVKVGGSALDERKVIVIQPTNGTIYLGFDSSVTSSNGLVLKKAQTLILEAGDSQPIFAIAASTVDVRIWELG